MFVALLVSILCVVVEIAHLYLARTELENALESAALAGADFWAKNPGDTAAARDVALRYAATNTVDGRPVILDPNYATGMDANQNASPHGNLIFGAVGFEPIRAADHGYLFEHNTVPSCTVTEVVEGEADIPWAVDAKDTYGTPDTFFLEFWNLDPPSLGLRITKITYGLAGIDGSGPGRFDVDTSPPAANEDTDDPGLFGWGPFDDLSAPVRVTFIPGTPDGGRYKTLEVIPATPLQPGDWIRFGVDTDMMAGTGGPNTTDTGGYFHTGNFYMAIEFNGDSANPVIFYGNGDGVHSGTNRTFLNRGQGQKFSFTITRPGAGRFAVRAQANVEVTPWLNSFLGVPIGPFRIAARTTASSGCVAPARLIRIAMATDGYPLFPDPTLP